MVKRQEILWDWALAAYQNPHVKDTCLELQDQFALDVNGLLWLCWLAGRGKEPTNRSLGEFRAISRNLQTGLIGKIRTIRKDLAGDAALMARPAALDLKRQLLELELVLEKSELEMLEALANKPVSGRRVSSKARARKNLDLLLAVYKIDELSCARLCDTLCHAIFRDAPLEP